MVSASGVQETSAGTVVVGRKKRYEAKGPGAARWNMFERRGMRLRAQGLLGGACLRGERG